MGEVHLKINKRTGQISLDGVGFKGKGCQRDLGELEELLGFKTISRRPKVQERVAVRTTKVRR